MRGFKFGQERVQFIIQERVQVKVGKGLGQVWRGYILGEGLVYKLGEGSGKERKGFSLGLVRKNTF